MVQITNVSNITGRPFLAHINGVIAMLLSPVSLASLSDTVTMKTLAVEPIWVPLPPMQTPSAKHHHNAAAFTP